MGIYSYTFMVACIFLVSFVIPVIYLFYERKQTLYKELLFLYRFVPTKVNDALSTYYQQLMSRDISNVEEINRVELPNFTDKKNIVRYSYTFQYNLKIRVVLTIVWALLVAISIIITYQMVQVFPTCKKMLRDINHLMDSENYLLENYF